MYTPSLGSRIGCDRRSEAPARNASSTLSTGTRSKIYPRRTMHQAASPTRGARSRRLSRSPRAPRQGMAHCHEAVPVDQGAVYKSIATRLRWSSTSRVRYDRDELVDCQRWRDVAGWMLALRWKTLRGSYFALSLASRSYFPGPYEARTRSSSNSVFALT